MTSTPINLNKERKVRAKATRRAQANENTIKFGRTKLQKAEDLNEAKRAENHLSLHQMETPSEI